MTVEEMGTEIFENISLIMITLIVKVYRKLILWYDHPSGSWFFVFAVQVVTQINSDRQVGILIGVQNGDTNSKFGEYKIRISVTKTVVN